METFGSYRGEVVVKNGKITIETPARVVDAIGSNNVLIQDLTSVPCCQYELIFVVDIYLFHVNICHFLRCVVFYSGIVYLSAVFA